MYFLPMQNIKLSLWQQFFRDFSLFFFNFYFGLSTFWPLFVQKSLFSTLFASHLCAHLLYFRVFSLAIVLICLFFMWPFVGWRAWNLNRHIHRFFSCYSVTRKKKQLCILLLEFIFSVFFLSFFFCVCVFIVFRSEKRECWTRVDRNIISFFLVCWFGLRCLFGYNVQLTLAIWQNSQFVLSSFG